MSLNSTSWKTRFLSFFYAVSFFFAVSPWAIAQEKEEEVAKDPVWVMSWAAFIFFAAATIMICVFFSKRSESILTQADQKRVAQIRADRLTKRRKEERLAKMRGQKK